MINQKNQIKYRHLIVIGWVALLLRLLVFPRQANPIYQEWDNKVVKMNTK